MPQGTPAEPDAAAALGRLCPKAGRPLQKMLLMS